MRRFWQCPAIIHVAVTNTKEKQCAYVAAEKTPLRIQVVNNISVFMNNHVDYNVDDHVNNIFDN